ALHAGTLVAPVVRRNVVKLARRFIAEESGDSLIKVLAALRREPAAFTLDVVGEATVSEAEAAAMQARYLELLRRLAQASAACRRWRRSTRRRTGRCRGSIYRSSFRRCARV